MSKVLAITLYFWQKRQERNFSIFFNLTQVQGHAVYENHKKKKVLEVHFLSFCVDQMHCHLNLYAHELIRAAANGLRL